MRGFVLIYRIIRQAGHQHDQLTPLKQTLPAHFQWAKKSAKTAELILSNKNKILKMKLLTQVSTMNFLAHLYLLLL